MADQFDRAALSSPLRCWFFFLGKGKLTVNHLVVSLPDNRR
jgi:hypothetical protein